MKKNRCILLLMSVMILAVLSLLGCGDKGECAAGHTYGEWVVGTPASCTASGEKFRTCTVCAHKETQTIAATEHTNDADGVCTVCGYGPYSQGLQYALNADGSAYTVSGSDDTAAEKITVPQVYRGLPVTAIGNSAFAYYGSLRQVDVPQSVTSIGMCAFWGCCGITAIELPQSVTSIGDYAFSGCSSLTEITVPGGVTAIGRNVFEGCTALESVELPQGVTDIGMSAFWGCSSLKGISIPNSVTRIGQYAFEHCTSLTSLIIPSAVTSIGQYAFEHCASLTSLIIPSAVTSIGTSAFDGCGRLHFNEYDNGLYLGNTDNPYFLLVKPKDTNVASRTINGNTKMIYHYAFENCKVTSIAIPDSVTSIGDRAFNNCGDLTSVTIGRGVTDIREDMFNDCKRLASITAVGENPKYSSQDGILYSKNKTQFVIIPKALSGEVTITGSITSIADYAFDSRKVTRIIMMSGVTYIGQFAFSGCNSLTHVTIPSSVKRIDGSAFNWCNNLTAIAFSGTKAQWDSIGKGGGWDSNTGDYTITCTDGSIDKAK